MRHYHTEKPKAVNTARSYTTPVNDVRAKRGKPQHDDTGFIDSGCSRHMTWNIAYLSDFKEFDGGYVTFRGGAHGGRISSKGTLKTDSLDFEDVYFVNELNSKHVLLVLKGSNTELLVSPRFTWVFFLTTKDETSEILKNFIKEIENLLDKKVKIIRSDNRTEFKNKVMDDFCREKGIKRKYSVAGLLGKMAEAVSTACYVQNRS
ncbi:putative ribonuclease H-like domain-containing protein [Tanacetum coccineum]